MAVLTPYSCCTETAGRDIGRPEWYSGDASADAVPGLGKSVRFCSISPDALLYALERFGLPPLFRGLILNLQQQDFPQSARLVIHRAYSVLCTSQGCPLSPFLFMILMTVLFTDREDTECPTMVFLPTQINLPKMCNGKLVNW